MLSYLKYYGYIFEIQKGDASKGVYLGSYIVSDNNINTSEESRIFIFGENSILRTKLFYYY